MKLLNSFWFVDVGRLLYNGPTISHFFINSRIKRWIDWKKWWDWMGGPANKGSAVKWNGMKWIYWWSQLCWWINKWMPMEWNEQAAHQAAPLRGKPKQRPMKQRWMKLRNWLVLRRREKKWFILPSIPLNQLHWLVSLVLGYGPEATNPFLHLFSSFSLSFLFISLATH